jgi:hypothetical protein
MPWLGDPVNGAAATFRIRQEYDYHSAARSEYGSMAATVVTLMECGFPGAPSTRLNSAARVSVRTRTATGFDRLLNLY